MLSRSLDARETDAASHLPDEGRRQMNFDFGRTAIVGEAEAVPASPLELRWRFRLHSQMMREVRADGTAMSVRPRVHASVRLLVAIITTSTQFDTDPFF